MGFFTTEKSQKLAQEFAVERGLISRINSCAARDEYVHVIADKTEKQIIGTYFRESYWPNHMGTGPGKVSLGYWSKRDEPSKDKLRRHLAEILGEFAWYASPEGKAAMAETDRYFEEQLAREAADCEQYVEDDLEDDSEEQFE